MSDKINHNRRRFLGTVVTAIAATKLVTIGSADAQSNQINPVDPIAVKQATTNIDTILPSSSGSLLRRRRGYANDGGIGHNLPQEAPQAFARAIVEVDGYRSTLA